MKKLIIVLILDMKVLRHKSGKYLCCVVTARAIMSSEFKVRWIHSWTPK